MRSELQPAPNIQALARPGHIQARPGLGGSIVLKLLLTDSQMNLIRTLFSTPIETGPARPGRARFQEPSGSNSGR